MLLSSKIRDYAARPREFETKEEIQRDLATRGMERPNLQAVPKVRLGDKNKVRLGGRGDKNLIKSKQIWKYWLDQCFYVLMICFKDKGQKQMRRSKVLYTSPLPEISNHPTHWH